MVPIRMGGCAGMLNDLFSLKPSSPARPLAIHQIVSFPAAQFKTPVVLQNQRRRFAWDHFSAHLRLSALVAPGDIDRLRLASRNRREKKCHSREITRDVESESDAPHWPLPNQGASLRAATPGQKYRCNSRANESSSKSFVFK